MSATDNPQTAIEVIRLVKEHCDATKSLYEDRSSAAFVATVGFYDIVSKIVNKFLEEHGGEYESDEGK